MKSLATNKERSDAHLISGVADFPLNLLSAGREFMILLMEILCIKPQLLIGTVLQLVPTI